MTHTGIPRILSIAGTDPSGGAGIQADLKSIAAQGGYGMAVVTALVAQNTRGVRAVHIPPAAFLREQLDAVSDDVIIDAVKIGMLAEEPLIAEVAAWLDRVKPPVVVLDPVMIASSGDRLLAPEAERALRDLARRADLITPNLPELAVLAGEPVAGDWEAALAQAERVSRALGVPVLAKGGHLAGDDAPDALVDASGALRGGALRSERVSPRIATENTHGTGCSLSSALATLRARGEDWEGALAHAKSWLDESLRAADTLAVGGGNGPIHHFAGLWDRGGLITAPTPEEVRTQWWADIAPIREKIYGLDFIRGLAEGALPAPIFRDYLAQDTLYLRDYSRALAEASRLAPTPEEQAFWAAGAQGAIAEEVNLHATWLDTEGTPLPAAEPETVAYLDHLLASSARGEYDVLIAALLPCYWLYHDVGTRLHAFSHPAHPYRSWLDTYADESFAVANARAIGLVSGRAARATPAVRERMYRAFELSSRHEERFFAAPVERAR